MRARRNPPTLDDVSNRPASGTLLTLSPELLAEITARLDALTDRSGGPTAHHVYRGALHQDAWPRLWLGSRALGNRGEAGAVGEEHGHVLALALDGATRAKDAIGKVLRGVGERCAGRG